MQNMKSVVKVVLLCSLAWCSPSLSAQHPDFQLSVSSAIKVSGVNTPISVSITLKNISAHDLSFATIVEDKQAEMNFVVKVRKQYGGSANESAYYQSLKRDRAAVSKQEVTLKRKRVIFPSGVVRGSA